MRVNVFVVVVSLPWNLPAHYLANSFSYLFTLSDAVRSSNNMALNGGMINEWGTAKNAGERDRDVVEVTTQVFALMAWGSHESTKNGRCRCRESNRELSAKTNQNRDLQNQSIWGFQGGDYEECHLLGCGNHLLTLVPHSRIYLPWRWSRYVPPKRRFTQYIHDATSQKMVFFLIC
jgi:hypothetical protein